MKLIKVFYEVLTDVRNCNDMLLLDLQYDYFVCRDLASVEKAMG